MNLKLWSTVICATFLIVASACSNNRSAPRVIVQIPSGFTGNFILEMGVKDAPPLEKRGEAYVLPVPRNGKVVTSTLLTDSKPSFNNSSEGTVWGYSHSVFTTGDGIPVGAKIEFFVGTQKDFEAEQGRKKHSGGLMAPNESMMSGM